MLLLDLTHTSHTHARTGVQKVTRALYDALRAQSEATPVTHDPYAKCWRRLQPWEEANLTRSAPARKRGARWPLRAKLCGSVGRWLGQADKPIINVQSASGLVVPEIFSPHVAASLPALLAQVKGPRVALFHDAIALKFPELSPPKTAARFPGYLRELLVFDGIAAVSEDSRATLLEFWRWLGITNHPPVRALPLAVAAPPALSVFDLPQRAGRPVILSVGSLEGRKNHLALLSACESLWSRGIAFELHLIGLAQPETGRAALEQLRVLQAAGRPLRYEGPVDDESLEAAYAECAFTVYPSLMEGFGLPVIESLERGKPCICSARGALGESSRGGGCLALPAVDSIQLAQAMESLLTDRALHDRLVAEARQRVFKRWPDYATELLAWMHTLPRRS